MLGIESDADVEVMIDADSGVADVSDAVVCFGHD